MYSLREVRDGAGKFLMISKKIVLVLGAGASMPFGFPLGPDLKNRIVNNLTANPDVLLAAGCREEEIPEFREALRTSGKKTIDAFLEHREEFRKIGKLAIAQELLDSEDKAKPRLYEPATTGNWYEYLFNKLNTRFEEFSQNAVSVLTFNYDRSLEYYLLNALKNSYGKTDTECAERLRSLPIVHLNGQLGELWELASSTDDSVAFGGWSEADGNSRRWLVERASVGISIIHDCILGKQFERAYALLREADLICFLGFGYDETNLLRISKYDPTDNEQSVIGSAKGMTDKECEIVYTIFKNLAMGCRPPRTGLDGTKRAGALDNINGEALQFLRHHCPFD